jgi:DNA-binding NtrC family response regulator
VGLRPLASRAGEILPLLDCMLAERGARLRESDLNPENQAALQAYAWPDNLVGLRAAADRLEALVRDGSLRKAADSLAMSKSTLHHWIERLGLSLPLTRSP